MGLKGQETQDESLKTKGENIIPYNCISLTQNALEGWLGANVLHCFNLKEGNIWWAKGDGTTFATQNPSFYSNVTDSDHTELSAVC